MAQQNKFIWEIGMLSILKKALWILLVFTTSAYAQKENKYIRNGNEKFNEKNYKDAEVDYMKALEKKPDSYKGQYNLGGALYKQDNYEDASKIYGSLASRDANDKEKSSDLYNLGNSLLKAKKYEESIKAYKNSLRINPEDMDTKYNLEYAKRMLQQQQQQQQQQNQDQNKDQKNKDEKNKDQQQKQDQNKEQQQQQQKQQQEQQQQQGQQPQQISKQDAERMLQALKNDENKTLAKVKLEKSKNAKTRKVEKDW